MTSIHTLITDIYYMLGGENWLTDERVAEFSTELATALALSFAPRGVPTLRLSAMGRKCPAQLWYSIHTPDAQEPLPAPARIKFAYGHVLEALIIAMAKGAGHEVTGEQDELIVDGVKGHRDCVIDGCIVDVKSCSSLQFQKFRDGSIAYRDTFGYLDQLDGYLVGSLDDDLVRVKDKAYILAVDKTLGHLCLYEHRLREASIKDRIKSYKRIVAYPEAPPCTCQSVKDGESGNFKLDTAASYNLFKHSCAENRGEKIRTFLYSGGPRYLTKVIRQPNVTEVDKYGKVVYN